MCCYFKQGGKVGVTKESIMRGYSQQVADAQQYLKPEQICTVSDVRTTRFTTDVRVEEVPGVTFNAEQFVPA